MIKLENVEVMGWEAAIRGMRNPMNSWEKSDSFCSPNDKCHECSDNQKCGFYFSDKGSGQPYRNRFSGDFHYIGPNDYDLMTRLRNAGTDHRKFMRMITVYVDITAPLYWWKEFDTYRVGIEKNSCSTMHKLAEKEFTTEDFSTEHLLDEPFPVTDEYVETYIDCMTDVIKALNCARRMFLETKDKKYWWQMIQLLPSSYNQKRTVMLNYEVLANIYESRKNHKLDEWIELCRWIETLPYSELITGPDPKDIPSGWLSGKLLSDALKTLERQ